MSALTSDSGTIWKFDTKDQRWEEVETRGERPEGRSYHTMCAMGVRLSAGSSPSPFSREP